VTGERFFISLLIFTKTKKVYIEISFTVQRILNAFTERTLNGTKAVGIAACLLIAVVDKILE
jgi:hypothetical protein